MYSASFNHTDRTVVSLLWDANDTTVVSLILFSHGGHDRHVSSTGGQLTRPFKASGYCPCVCCKASIVWFKSLFVI